MLRLAAFLFMEELNDFYNAGFGWSCRQCERELKAAGSIDGAASRVFREGEDESKTPNLENGALAKWVDAVHQILVCPRCGLTESVDKR